MDAFLAPKHVVVEPLLPQRLPCAALERIARLLLELRDECQEIRALFDRLHQDVEVIRHAAVRKKGEAAAGGGLQKLPPDEAETRR
jgi:hypothetical protein